MDETRLGGSQGSLRRDNEERVVAVLRRLGQASQAQVSRETGLSPAAVNSIVAALQAEGSVVALPGKDRRSSRQRLAHPRGVIACLDVGDPSTYLTLFDFDSQIRHDRGLELHAESSESGLADVRAALSDLLRDVGLSRTSLNGLVIGLRSPIDAASHQISPIGALPGWRGVNLRDRLASEYGCEVSFENDANLSALAELTWGAGAGGQDFLYLKTAPGVGAGLVIGGELYRGGNGMAGEVGHMVLDPGGPLCECGNRGCLHAYSSSRMMLSQVRDIHPDIRSVSDIVRRARQGDGACERLLSEAAVRVGQAVANTVQVLGLTVVVVAGPLVEAGHRFLDPLRQTVDSLVIPRAGSPLEVRSGIPRPDTSRIGGLASFLRGQRAALPHLETWITGEPTRTDKD